VGNYVDGALFVRHGPGYTDEHGVMQLRVAPINIRICQRCGSLVGLEDEHDVWHQALSAQYANTMLRPVAGAPS
jgi:hypothetical protein